MQATFPPASLCLCFLHMSTAVLTCASSLILTLQHVYVFLKLEQAVPVAILQEGQHNSISVRRRRRKMTEGRRRDWRKVVWGPPPYACCGSCPHYTWFPGCILLSGGFSKQAAKLFAKKAFTNILPHASHCVFGTFPAIVWHGEKGL